MTETETPRATADSVTRVVERLGGPVVYAVAVEPAEPISGEPTIAVVDPIVDDAIAAVRITPPADDTDTPALVTFTLDAAAIGDAESGTQVLRVHQHRGTTAVAVHDATVRPVGDVIEVSVRVDGFSTFSIAAAPTDGTDGGELRPVSQSVPLADAVDELPAEVGWRLGLVWLILAMVALAGAAILGRRN